MQRLGVMERRGKKGEKERHNGRKTSVAIRSCTGKIANVKYEDSSPAQGRYEYPDRGRNGEKSNSGNA